MSERTADRLGEALEEIADLREENARLKADAAEADDVMRGADMGRQRAEALLGRAVAALRELRESVSMETIDDALFERIDAILADSAATAAAESWRAQQDERAELEAVYQAARSVAFYWRNGVVIDGAEDGEALRRPMVEAIAKVDARRFGGKDGGR